MEHFRSLHPGDGASGILHLRRGAARQREGSQGRLYREAVCGPVRRRHLYRNAARPPRTVSLLCGQENAKLKERILKANKGKTLDETLRRYIEELGHAVGRSESMSKRAYDKAVDKILELDNLIDAGFNFRTAEDEADGHTHDTLTGPYNSMLYSKLGTNTFRVL